MHIHIYIYMYTYIHNYSVCVYVHTYIPIYMCLDIDSLRFWGKGHFGPASVRLRAGSLDMLGAVPN